MKWLRSDATANEDRQEQNAGSYPDKYVDKLQAMATVTHGGETEREVAGRGRADTSGGPLLGHRVVGPVD